MTDPEILQKIKDDDPRIISFLYKSYHDEFIRFVRKNFPEFSTDSAEDAYSESFHALYRNVKNEKLTTLTSSLKTYLFQIGKRKVFDEINRNNTLAGKEIVNYLPEEEILSLDFYEEKDEAIKKTRILSETVALLKEPCKTLLNLFWFRQKRDAEIVELTEYTSTDTVKNQRSRCMRNLKKEYLTRLVSEGIISSAKRTELLEK